MIKTITTLLKQDKEKFAVPKGVQNIIPVKTIYSDGIFQIGKNKYSMSYKFEDINQANADSGSGKTIKPVLIIDEDYQPGK